MISGLNEQLQQQLDYTLLNPDCHSWWFSKMQSGHEDTLEERYAIKLCFKLGKIPQKRIECFRLLFDHLAWIERQFFSGIRDSTRAGSLWGMVRGVGGVRKSIHRSWLAKRLGLGLLCWGFKGVQKEIPSEEASTLQIGSVAFPPGQCTSPQLHPCHWLFEQASLQSRPCSLWLLVFPEAQRLLLWDNWGDERCCDEGHWHAHTRGLPWGLAEVVGTVQQVHWSRRRLLRIKDSVLQPNLSWWAYELFICLVHLQIYTYHILLSFVADVRLFTCWKKTFFLIFSFFLIDYITRESITCPPNSFQSWRAYSTQKQQKTLQQGERGSRKVLAILK